MATLSEDTFKAISSADLKQLRTETKQLQKVEYIESFISYNEFFTRFLVRNKPCVFGSDFTKGWRALREWVLEDGTPNLDYLAATFGHVAVPVADCKRVEYSAQPKTEMQLSQYIKYWCELRSAEWTPHASCLYLKDWHFTKLFPDYKAYETPTYFTSDWLNEYWDSKSGQNADDYRFVYMGPKGSWTPFHADVFRSYSWSANICGRKRWLLYPPGQEDNLRDKFGNLAYDILSPELHNQNNYPRYNKACRPLEVLQGPGEIIFVPSGWHHQVFNIEDTISVNHNWLNGCNLDITWAFLQQELVSVKNSISDCRDMDGWDQQCRMIMKANTGIDYPEFLQLLWRVAEPRLLQLRFCNRHNGNHSKNKHVLGELEDSCQGTIGQSSSRSGVFKTRAADVLVPRKQGEIVQSYRDASHNAVELRIPSLQVASCVHDLNKAEKLERTASEQFFHWMFDLFRIHEILESLLHDDDFRRIQRGSLCVDPQLFKDEIDCAINYSL